VADGENEYFRRVYRGDSEQAARAAVWVRVRRSAGAQTPAILRRRGDCLGNIPSAVDLSEQADHSPKGGPTADGMARWQITRKVRIRPTPSTALYRSPPSCTPLPLDEHLTIVRPDGTQFEVII
jgi:hypothetical protein